MIGRYGQRTVPFALCVLLCASAFVSSAGILLKVTCDPELPAKNLLDGRDARGLTTPQFVKKGDPQPNRGIPIENFKPGVKYVGSCWIRPGAEVRSNSAFGHGLGFTLQFLGKGWMCKGNLVARGSGAGVWHKVVSEPVEMPETATIVHLWSGLANSPGEGWVRDIRVVPANARMDVSATSGYPIRQVKVISYAGKTVYDSGVLKGDARLFKCEIEVNAADVFTVLAVDEDGDVVSVKYPEAELSEGAYNPSEPPPLAVDWKSELLTPAQRKADLENVKAEGFRVVRINVLPKTDLKPSLDSVRESGLNAVLVVHVVSCNAEKELIKGLYLSNAELDAAVASVGNHPSLRSWEIRTPLTTHPTNKLCACAQCRFLYDSASKKRKCSYEGQQTAQRAWSIGQTIEHIRLQSGRPISLVSPPAEFGLDLKSLARSVDFIQLDPTVATDDPKLVPLVWRALAEGSEMVGCPRGAKSVRKLRKDMESVWKVTEELPPPVNGGKSEDGFTRVQRGDFVFYVNVSGEPRDIDASNVGEAVLGDSPIGGHLTIQAYGVSVLKMKGAK